MQRDHKKIKKTKKVIHPLEIVGSIIVAIIIIIIVSPFIAYAVLMVFLVQRILQIVVMFAGIEDIIAAFYNGVHVILLMWFTVAFALPIFLIILIARIREKKPKKKDIQIYNRIFAGFILAFMLILTYSFKSYIIITHRKIYISGITTLFHQREYSYHVISDLIFKATRGKSNYSLSIFLDIDNERINLNEVGFFASGTSISTVRGIYLFLKDNAPNKIKINYENLTDHEIEYLKKIMQN